MSHTGFQRPWQTMENSQAEGSAGDKEPLQKRRHVDDNEQGCCRGDKPAKVYSIQHLGVT